MHSLCRNFPYIDYYLEALELLAVADQGLLGSEDYSCLAANFQVDFRED